MLLLFSAGGFNDFSPDTNNILRVRVVSDAGCHFVHVAANAGKLVPGA